MFQPDSFNPLDYGSLSDSIATALMAAEVVPLGEVEPFLGSGVYALFYRGDFPAYRRIAERNRERSGSWPIYVGKAAPSTRKGDRSPDAGSLAPTALLSGNALFRRVTDHRSSIDAADNLLLLDFDVRLLVLSYLWVPMAETAMLYRFHPIWNSIVDGFGNHNPGKGRINGVRSRWDTLHPGRPWAPWFPERMESSKDIEQDVRHAIDESMR